MVYLIYIITLHRKNFQNNKERLKTQTSLEGVFIQGNIWKGHTSTKHVYRSKLVEVPWDLVLGLGSPMGVRGFCHRPVCAPLWTRWVPTNRQLGTAGSQTSMGLPVKPFRWANTVQLQTGMGPISDSKHMSEPWILAVWRCCCSIHKTDSLGIWVVTVREINHSYVCDINTSLMCS